MQSVAINNKEIALVYSWSCSGSLNLTGIELTFLFLLKPLSCIIFQVCLSCSSRSTFHNCNISLLFSFLHPWRKKMTDNLKDTESFINWYKCCKSHKARKGTDGPWSLNIFGNHLARGSKSSQTSGVTPDQQEPEVCHTSNIILESAETLAQSTSTSKGYVKFMHDTMGQQWRLDASGEPNACHIWLLGFTLFDDCKTLHIMLSGQIR